LLQRHTKKTIARKQGLVNRNSQIAAALLARGELFQRGILDRQASFRSFLSYRKERIGPTTRDRRLDQTRPIASVLSALPLLSFFSFS